MTTDVLTGHRTQTTSLDARTLVLVGAATTALAGCFIQLSGVAPSTSTFFRCLLALPILGYLALREVRRHGWPSRRVLAAQMFGGLMLGIDFAVWAQSVTMIGAGIATVVVNVQIIVVPLLAWGFFRHRVPLRFVLTVPVLLTGVALAGGVFGGTGSAHQLLLGTLLSLAAGVAYGVYIFVIGRAVPETRACSQVFVATVVAGVFGTALGSLWGTVDFTPGWWAMGWLAALALCSQVLGWMCLSLSLPRLASEVGATLLLTQPVMAMAFAMVLVHERPTSAQLLGCAIVVAAVWMLTRKRI